MENIFPPVELSWNTMERILNERNVPQPGLVLQKIVKNNCVYCSEIQNYRSFHIQMV